MSDSVKKVVIFPIDQWSEIAQWRWDNRINTESDSMRNLIQAGLHYYRLMQDPAFAAVESQTVERLNAASN